MVLKPTFDDPWSLLQPDQETLELQNLLVCLPFNDSLAFFEQGWKCLKPGGVLTVTVPNFTSKFHILMTDPTINVFDEMRLLFTVNGIPVRCFYTISTFEHVLKALGAEEMTGNVSAREITITCKKPLLS